MKNKKLRFTIIISLVFLAILISYVRVNYHRSSVFFSSNFDGDEYKGFKIAEFVKLNGNDYYSIDVENIEAIHYQYSSELEGGAINLTLNVNNKTIWQSGSLQGEVIDSGQISVKKGDKVKLRVVGKRATGNYNFQWVGK